MSTDRQGVSATPRSVERWGQVRILRAPPVRHPPDATEIARRLIDKYGAAALSLARERAGRAIEVGDELALDSWRSVIEATKRLLGQSTAL